MDANLRGCPEVTKTIYLANPYGFSAQQKMMLLPPIGNVPGIFATVIYAVPPAIWLTNLGIRQVRHRWWRRPSPSAPPGGSSC